MKLLKKRASDFFAKWFNITNGEVSILNAHSGFVSYRTGTEELRMFVKKLHPVSDDHLNMIRFGPNGDGGYLIPDDLDGIEACFSPGVSSISSFEKDCADRGMKVFMADRSVDAPAESHEHFYFSKKYVGALSDEMCFTMDDWVDSCELSSYKDLILQMDIENSEYETLLSASHRLIRRFRIMVIEFHLLDQLWNQSFFRLASRVFEKILKTHVCMHIHPNNRSNVIEIDGIGIPEMMEFTFVRSDRLINPQKLTCFPHPLDCDNTDCSSLSLPTAWYSSK